MVSGRVGHSFILNGYLGTLRKDKEWVIRALQPNLYQWARWLTISAKPLIALEIDLSFFKLWCSSFQGKLDSPGKGATWGRQCWPAAVHTQCHPGESLCAHMCVHTHASTFAEDLCSYHEYRFRQKQAKTRQEANMLQIRPSQPFLFHCHLPHPQGRIMCPFFPSFQTVVGIVTF